MMLQNYVGDYRNTLEEIDAIMLCRCEAQNNALALMDYTR